MPLRLVEVKGGTGIRRFVRLGALGLCALGLASSVPAGAFGGFITPGHQAGTGAYGFSTLSDASGNSLFVQVSAGLVTFKPRHPSGSLITQPGNVVSLSISSQGIYGFGCWLMPASDFVLNPDLSATLSLNSADPRVQECPGAPIGTPLLGARPALPADGVILGIVQPVQLTSTWASSGPATAKRSTTKVTCGPFASITEATQQDVKSTTSAAVATTLQGFNWFLGQTVTVPVDVQFQGGDGSMAAYDNHTNIIGPSTGYCGEFGIR